MSGNNQTNIVDEIKSRCNIVDIIGRVVPLKRAGSNYKGICPFHNEKTPSFVVSETKQIFTCFGCGATGDLFEFVMRYYNLDFRGALEMLAKEYGISLEGAFSGGNKHNEELYEVNRQAARFFYRAMRERANPGYTYMKNRGISEETLNRFGIGYADDSWDSLYHYLRNQGIEDEKMIELGLVSKSGKGHFDKFRGRVIFPIQNTRGKVIGFGGRIIGDGEPKYLNSPESPVFKKKNNLYGLNLTGSDVRREDAIVLVEGYMDVVSLYQAGVRNVSASLGTALTENQVKLIKRYTKNVFLSYDADQAGQKAALRGMEILYGENCNARVLKVTEGKDPDEFVKKNGKSAFVGLMDEALPYGDFRLGYLRNGYDIDDSQQRIEYTEAAIDVLRGMKPVEADIYIKKLAAETGISEGAIRSQYSAGVSGDTYASRPPATIYEERSGEKAEADMPLVEKDLIKLMMLDASFRELPEDIREEAFRSEQGRSIYESLLAASADGAADPAKIREMLGEEAAECFADIEEMVIPAGREQEMFEDCTAKIRREMLKRREHELMIRLSMADDDIGQEEIEALMKQLIQIQKELKN